MSVHCTCSRHYITVFFCCWFYSFLFFSEALSDELSRLTGLCTEPENVSPTLGGLLYSLLEKLRTNERRQRRRKKKREILDYFGGLVLDCITTVSGVQSVIAECSLYICVHYILQEKKTVE